MYDIWGLRSKVHGAKACCRAVTIPKTWSARSTTRSRVCSHSVLCNTKDSIEDKLAWVLGCAMRC